MRCFLSGIALELMFIIQWSCSLVFSLFQTFLYPSLIPIIFDLFNLKRQMSVSLLIRGCKDRLPCQDGLEQLKGSQARPWHPYECDASHGLFHLPGQLWGIEFKKMSAMILISSPPFLFLLLIFFFPDFNFPSFFPNFSLLHLSFSMFQQW